MIILIWRNITSDLQYSDSLNSVLGFSSSTATIGGSAFSVDNDSLQIGGGYGQLGSGVTITTYLNADPFKNAIHEFAHYLLGNNDFHNGFGFWGMLSAWGAKSYVANSWERYKLGWMEDVSQHTINGTPSQTLTNKTLGDFLETGNAYRFVIDSTGDINNHKYIFVENHQVTNYWENNSPFYWKTSGIAGNIEPGVYVIRRDGTLNQYDTPSWLQCVPADGRDDWEVNQFINTTDGELPVFKYIGSDIENGYHDLEFVHYTYMGSNHKDVIHYTEDENGDPELDVRFHGDGLDAFRIGYNEIFSPYSNPNNQNKDRDTTNFGFYLKSEASGVYTLDLYVGTSEEAPPSKPQGLSVSNTAQIIDSFRTYTYSAESHLSWIANTETDFDKYRIYKATTTSTAPGLNDYILIDSTTSTSTNIDINDFGDNRKIYYRITAVDTDGKESVLSESNWDYAPPSSPSNVDRTTYNNYPKITWDASNFSNAKYDVYRKDPSRFSSWSRIATTSNSYYIDENYTIYDASADKAYVYYKVTAKRKNTSDVYISSNFSNQIGVPVNWYPQVWKESVENEALPEVYAISQNYPNPFNPTTSIKYQLPKNSFVTISIYDMLGREVANLVNEEQEAGYYEFSFDGSQLSSGTYIYKITAGDFTDSKKLLLVK